MSNRPKPVSCRPHPEINRKLEELADERRTTKARLLEEWIKEKIEEEMGHGKTDGGLPEGVYVPDSRKYDYALKYTDGQGKSKRRYYKTRRGVVQAAERLRG